MSHHVGVPPFNQNFTNLVPAKPCCKTSHQTAGNNSPHISPHSTVWPVEIEIENMPSVKYSVKKKYHLKFQVNRRGIRRLYLAYYETQKCYAENFSYLGSQPPRQFLV